MGKYQGYDKYKDSGVEWLGDVPEHWNVQKFLRAAFFQEGPGLRNWQFSDNGIRVICVTNITDKGIDFSNYQKFIEQEDYEKNYKHFTVRKNDLLLSSSGNSWGKVAEYLSDEIVILNTSTIRINQHENLCADRVFLKWMLQSVYLREQLSLLMTGSCQPNFGPSHLGKTIITIPPLNEQEKIARFLDYKTKQIDKLIAKKETLIEKLDEKRTSLISHAVTKGLDVNVPMKDSGIEWLGEIPKHWGVKRLKQITKLIDGDRGKNYPNENDLQDEGIPFLSTENIKFNAFEFTQRTKFITLEKFESLGRGKLIQNDLVVTMRGTIGQTALFHKVPYETAFINAQMIIARPTNIFAEFLRYISMSVLWEKQLDFYSYGTAQQQLSGTILGNLRLGFPPLEEQQKIAEYLDQKTAEIEEQKAKIQQAIDLLKEYRTALITNAVTGKIDVSQVDIS